MQRFLVSTTVVAMLALGATVALRGQQGRAEVALRAAIETETVKGDLKAAIEQYKKVVEQHKDNRAVAAQALLRMAGCYQRVDEREAVKLLERVLREYGDQPEAVAVARARLPFEGRAAAASPSSRQLWTGPKVDVSGSVSPDGRHLSFVDWDSGDLALHEFSSGQDRRLTNEASKDGTQHADVSVISRDGKEVAYAWYNNPKFRSELRVVRLDTPTVQRPTILVDSDEITYIRPHDWSPDNKSLAVRLTRADRTTQLALIRTADGAVTVLKSVDWRGPTRMAFSPDGQWLAYDIPIGDSSAQRDVMILAVDGSREIAVAAHPAYDRVLGWSASGDTLMFASDRSGAVGLWASTIRKGVPQEPASLIRPDLGPLAAGLGVTRAGALVFAQKKGAISIYTAEIDFATGKLASNPKPVGENYLRDDIFPMWAPDGKTLAYQSAGMGQGAFISIHSIERGTTRELKPRMSSFLFPRWAPDGTFIVQGADLKGRQGIYRINADTGDPVPIAAADGSGYRSHPSVSTDGRTLAYRRQIPGQATIVLRDLSTDAERDLIQLAQLGFFRLSPDGRHIAYVAGDKGTKSMSLNVLSVAGRASKELLRVTEPQRIHSNLVEWTPDSTGIVFGRNVDQADVVSLLPLAGGPEVRLQLSITNGTLRIHPEGRLLAYSAGASSYEIWTLENFLPRPGGSSSRR